MSDPILERHIDGTVTVVHAEPLIRVSRALLQRDDLRPGVWDGATLTLDTAGEYRYRYARPDPENPRDVLLFERIEQPAPAGPARSVTGS